MKWKNWAIFILSKPPYTFSTRLLKTSHYREPCHIMFSLSYRRFIIFLPGISLAFILLYFKLAFSVKFKNIFKTEITYIMKYYMY